MNLDACVRAALCSLSITTTAAVAPMARAADAPAIPAPPAEASAPLEPVVIRGSKLPELAGQRSIPAQELRSVPGSLGDPLKSLQSLPGVASVSDASSDPAIRGSRPEDNRFLIDGLPAGRVFHVGGLTSVLHPDLVSRFDLYAAAFGPEFANATGGIIDVKLRRPRTDRLGGTLDLGALGADLLIEGPLAPGQSFYFAGKRSWIDLFVKRASDGKEEGGDGTILQMPKYHDYLGKYFWRLDETHELRLHASGASDRLDLEVPADSKLAQQEPVFAGAGRFRGSDHSEALTLESSFASGAVNRLSLGQHTARADNQLGSALRMDVTQRDRYLLEELRLAPLGAHTLTLGGELHDVQSDYSVNLRKALCTEFSPDCDYSSAEDVATADRVQLRLSTLYARDRWQFLPEWAATLGLHHSRDAYLKRHDTEPRLGLEWQWSAQTLLSAGWGRYNQIPQPDQIVRELGNPALDHLHATHAVLGLSQSLGERWSWRAELYRKTMSDLVVADATRNYINGGSGTAHGVELLLKKHAVPGEALSGWLAVSWARSQRHNDVTGEAFRFAYDQPLIVNAVGVYRLGHGWQTSAKWTYHTGAPDTAVVGTYTATDGRLRPVYGPLNGERLPPYHRLDLRVEKQVSRDFHFYVELINAYRRRNVAGWSYSADYQSRTPVEQLGLLPSAGIRWDF